MQSEYKEGVRIMNYGKMGMTIEEAAEISGIGRNTLRKLVDWGKSLVQETQDVIKTNTKNKDGV